MLRWDQVPPAVDIDADRDLVHGLPQILLLLHSLLLCRSLWNLLNSVSFWFAAELSFFYCIKIAIFTHPVFPWLKQKILWLVALILMGYMLVSCASALPLIIHDSTPATWRNDSGPSTETEEKTFHSHYALSMMFIPLCVPFLLLLISSVLLTTSLRRHLRAIQYHALACRTAAPRLMHVHSRRWPPSSSSMFGTSSLWSVP
ncbi:taste receptor type 2 member 134-like [Ornithorhynchus anatinus]|uniref:taste receptor type 2 member 134-like n=1 Tax=Ornithorhynchus anatinus TaxID=9258 RepID=UPI0019D48950|nr:taste receptor type 2 member 134-like [Ornithorhynchus anatinus]